VKPFVILVILLVQAITAFSQKTLLVEKIGTSSKYFYHKGDFIKIKVRDGDSVVKGQLWDIGDSVISIAGLRPFDIKTSNIGVVYKQYAFPKKLSRYLGIFSALVFGIITTNHVINNEQVFTSDLFIISGAIAGGSLISLALSEKRCRIGSRWKIKVLDMNVY
jgi:hypothetical protein